MIGSCLTQSIGRPLRNQVHLLFDCIFVRLHLCSTASFVRLHLLFDCIFCSTASFVRLHHLSRCIIVRLRFVTIDTPLSVEQPNAPELTELRGSSVFYGFSGPTFGQLYSNKMHSDKVRGAHAAPSRAFFRPSRVRVLLLFFKVFMAKGLLAHNWAITSEEPSRNFFDPILSGAGLRIGAENWARKKDGCRRLWREKIMDLKSEKPVSGSVVGTYLIKGLFTRTRKTLSPDIARQNNKQSYLLSPVARDTK
jgi:hypothetical protein